MKLKYAGCLPAAALAVAFAPASFAQDRLAPVIVTAPGPDRSADELIGNATAIDRDEILERLAGSLGDTLDREPGVATTFFGQGASRPVLRGLGAERVQVLTNGIGVIDASAASPDHQVAADGIDATNIEILRGPAALAYGGQAIGGVVNVIDGLIVEDLPEEAASGDLFGAWNSVNEGSELGGHGQLVAGPLVFSLSASRRDFDDFDIPGMAESSLFHALEEAEEEEHEEDEDHEEEEGEDHDHEEEEHIEGTLPNSFLETETLAAGLSWVGDNGFFGVAVRRQTAEYGLPGHSHEHGHEDEDHEDEEHEGEEEDHDEEEHDHEEEMPFIDLEQTRIDIRGGITLDSGFLTDITGTFAIADYEHTEFEAPGEAGTVYETDGVEGRLEFGHALGEVQGTAGLQFLDKDFAAFGEEALISPTTNQTISLFVYETREWESGLGLEGGLRLEQAELENDVFGSAEFDLISGSAGLHKHFDGGWFLGAQIAHTERAPNETELFADGPHLATGQYERGNPDLDTERGLNLEGTARWRGDTASFGINLFATNFSDFIYLTPGVVLVDGAEADEVDELPVFLFAQEDADFLGGEIYGVLYFDDAALGADWSFDASLDFVSAELDSGENVPYLPPVTLNAGAEAAWDSFSLGAAITLAGEQDDPGLGQLPTDSYTTLDLRAEADLALLGLPENTASAFLEARNVTDEEVRHATSVLKDIVPAPGQNIRAGLKLTF